MPVAPDRRLVILAEGNFGFHHGKTAMGVIRFGTRQGRRRHRLHPGRSQRPRVAGRLGPVRHPDRRRRSTTPSGSCPRADALLIGIAPDRRQAARRVAGDRSWPRSGPAWTSCPGSTRSSATTRSSRTRPRSSGVRLVDYRRPPERMETAVGRRHVPGKRVILTVGTDCAIGKMSVALELRRAAAGGGPIRVVRARPGQTGMMIEGWGVAVDRVISRLRPGHRRVAGRGGRAARRLGARRGPGIARPPRVQQRHPRADPRHDAARDDPRPQAGHGRPRLRPPARTRRFPIAPLPPLHPHPRGGRGAGRAVEGRRRRAQHVAHPGRGRGAPDHRGDRGRDRAAARPTRSASAADALWREIEAAVDALPWVGAGAEPEAAA